MEVVDAKVSGQSQNLYDVTEKDVCEKVKSSAARRRSIDRKKMEPSIKWKNTRLSASHR